MVLQLGEITLIELHRNIMSSIIIQLLSNYPLLVRPSQGPKSFSYAQVAGSDAGTARRQTFKFTPRIKPCPSTQFPCLHCINVSLILAGAKRKVIDAINVQTAKADIETIATRVPLAIRQDFKEIYTQRTLSQPNHTEKFGGPLSSSQV